MSPPTCHVCGRTVAAYICRECGNPVCNNCFNPASWSCSECQTKGGPVISAPQLSLGTWLFFIAFAMIFIGMVLMAVGSLSNIGSISGGAVILIGPFPVILGAGPYSAVLIGLAIILTIFALAFYFLIRRAR